MAQVKVVETINASIDRVWAQLGNFAGIEAGPGIESVDYNGEGVGMTRAIHLANGTVVERLEQHDSVTKSFTYAIINDDAPLPFANYSATVQLRSDDKDSTTVEWTGSFDPKGVEEEKAVKIATGIYTNAINGARQALDAGASSGQVPG
jgi:carbon monoxide dehydrogenase subunit G